jgi:signal transduction histidine kinase
VIERGRTTGVGRAVAFVLVVGAVGAAGTFAVGSAVGMHRGELAHLGLLLLPALAVTAMVTAAAAPLLGPASTKARLVVVSVVGAALSLANLAALARTMFVSRHDATTVGVLLLYSLGVGIGAAVALARSTGRAVARVAAAARAWGEGDLGVRIGPVSAGHELHELAEELNRMAHRLQNALEAERGSEQARRDLITAVSHDLRTPLSGLRAMIEAIDDRIVERPETIRRYAGEMRRSVGTLVKLVDDLFELVRVDAGAFEAEGRDARLETVVASAVATCRVQAGERGVAVVSDLDGTADVPCSPRLERVLQNLLQNAIRHTPSSGAVRLRASRGGGSLFVTVTDTGEGMAASMLPHVFEAFWRGEPARAGEGSGLGLALAKSIIERLGGSIDASSEPGRGSRFTVRLPAA